MKKLSYFLSISAMVALVTFSACKKDDGDDTTDEVTCAEQVYPTTSGTATVEIKNFGATATVNAGDIIAIAVEITKGDNRPQKLRVYQTDCENAKGDIVTFQGQAKTNSAGDEIDLANTDEPQVRTINYTVPTGMSTIYLNFEVDESGGKYTYEQLTLTVSGSGIMDTRSDITVGAQTNSTLGSRLSSALGYVYTACEVPQNLTYIDIVHVVSLNSPYKNYLTSNPARSTGSFYTTDLGSPNTTGNYSSTCEDDAGNTSGTFSTAGGTSTYFKLYTGSTTFDNVVESDLNALTVSASNNQYIEITSTSSNNVFEFLNSNGKKGLIRVDGGNLANTTGSITVDIKVQR